MPATTAAADSSTVITGRRMKASETFMSARPSSRLLALAVLAWLVACGLLGRLRPALLRFGDRAAGAKVLRALDHDAGAGIQAVDHGKALLEVREAHVALGDLVVGTHHVDEALVGTGLHRLRGHDGR